MKKALFFLLTITVFNSIALAQDWRSKYEQVDGFWKGIARVKKGGKYGFVDSTGKEVVEPIYDRFDYSFRANGGLYYRNVFRVAADNKWGYMDRSGKIIVPLEYEEVALNPGLRDHPTAVKKNGKWGFVNIIDGRLVIPCSYDSYERNYSLLDKPHIPYFDAEGAYVVLTKGEMVGALDKNGSVIIPFEYLFVATSDENKNEIEARKTEDGKSYSFFYSLTGKFLRKKRITT